MTASLAIGLAADLTRQVGVDDTAIALGSGDVPVLATPRLIALAEAATVAAIAPVLDASHTTVGTRVELDHLAATPVGDTVKIMATLVEVAGRRLQFDVWAERAADGQLLAEGHVTRVLVDRDRFLSGGG